MADLGAFGKVNLSQLGSLGRVNVASIGSINKIQIVSSVPDSISLDVDYLYFYQDGVPQASGSVYVTASGSWYAKTISLGYGIFFTPYPPSGTTSTNVSITCDYYDPTSGTRSGRIRFWRGSVYADLTVYQVDYM